ncbi:COOH terminal WSC domain-containing protein [Trichoderma chlorosporum]
MKFTTSAAAAAMAGVAVAAKDSRTFAVMRFTNKGLVTERADPIVQPGIASSHVHNILGGSAFSLTSTGEDLLKSSCSTALVKGDYSNYWYPTLYFHDPKTGILEYVDVYYTNVYYFFEATNDDITAFPVGLQMVSGSPALRTPPATGSDQLDPSKGPINAIQFTCPRSSYNPASYPVGSNGTTFGMVDPTNQGAGVGFPDVTCDGLYSPLRMDIHFPSCYNPAAGLTNYKENMQFPTDAGDGKQDCPPGWIHTPHIFYEVYFDTQPYQGRWVENQAKQPFVLSNGDETGYSAHADFMAGWEVDVLQGIIDGCNAGDSGMDQCPNLPYGLNSGDCTIPPVINEQVMGNLTALPGNNPLTGFGDVAPAMGSAPASSSKPAALSPTSKPAASSPTSKPAASSPTSKPASSPSSKPASSPAKTPASSPSNVINAGQPAKTIESTPSSSPAPAAGGDAQCSAANVHTVTETITVTASTPAATSSAPTKGNSAANVDGYTYVGCYEDNINRVLTGDILPDLGPMTNDLCVANCVSKGFSIAATEYGGQCYCGNELVGSSKIDDSQCSMACEGNSKEVCGGSWAISVYSKTGSVTMQASKARRSHARRHRSQRN